MSIYNETVSGVSSGRVLVLNDADDYVFYLDAMQFEEKTKELDLGDYYFEEEF